MKYFLIICFLAISLISANSNSYALSNSENNRISFETLKTLIQDIDRRLSKLEDKFEKEEKQLQDPNSDNISRKDTMGKVNKRLAKIEKKISMLDIKGLVETFKSFEGTLNVFKKRLSDVSKRIEDSEVNVAVIERMYRKTQDYVEPPKITVSKSKEKQFQIENKDSGNIVEAEIIEKRKESTKLKGLRESTEPKTLIKSKMWQDIGNGFSVKNVTFDKYGTSSIVKVEIKNNSDNDIKVASFIMKLFGEGGKIIAEIDFHVRKIASDAIKPFEETIRGVSPSQILKYEIKHRTSI